MFSTNYKEFIDSSRFVAFEVNVRGTSLICVVEMVTGTRYHITDAELEFFMNLHHIKGITFDLKMEAAQVLGSAKMWVNALRGRAQCADLDMHLRKILHSADARRIECIRNIESGVEELIEAAQKDHSGIMGQIKYRRLEEGAIVSKGETHFLRKTKKGIIPVNNIWLQSRIKLENGQRIVKYEKSVRAQGISKILQIQQRQSNLSVISEEAA